MEAFDMRKVIASIYSTLDGVVERPGEDGWTQPYFNDEAAKIAYDQLFSCDALLLGRVTYEGFAQAWPNMTDTGDFGVRMNTMPKYVVSKTLDRAEWTNTTVIGGDLAAEVSRLKEQPGQDILVYGSGQLVNSLIDLGLLDELRLWIHPVVTARGKRLFEDRSQVSFKTLDVTTLSTGLVIVGYGPADAPA
jgi:dihydrofolate reductase